ncbi:leucine-rich repeat protein 1-like [Argentina anserina]|uniref:leucine-rich repeat protein 1-like n=1 Tax=Argentina anserina TaxID=57926 RepID=UPI0021765269|nr:leucine-rich repeat protein 1-like [Potentilla anserina]
MTIDAIWWMLLLSTLITCLIPAYTWPLTPEMQALDVFRMGVRDPDEVLDWDLRLPNQCTWYGVTCNSENQTTSLVVHNKNLWGALPSELGQLPALGRLELPYNRLWGTIPSELGNLKRLVYLSLSGNQLSGSIPASLGNLKSLDTLNLDNNEFTGKVPSAISKIPALRVADFSNNGKGGQSLCWDFWPTPVFKGRYSLCQKK